MKIHLMAWTVFDAEEASDITGWEPEERAWDGPGGSSFLSEFAGRACYESWGKPNPATAMNADYLGHIIDVGHGSVMEHGSATLYVTECSRSFTHELIRHRHNSYSQLSQRFAKLKTGQADTMPKTGVDFVVPPLFDGDYHAESILAAAWDTAVSSYDALIARAEQLLADLTFGDADTIASRTAARKEAREAARAVLPNMTPTAIVVTGNHRAWRELMVKRGSLHADAEIRQFAVEALKILSDLEPNLYQDLSFRPDPRGRNYIVDIGTSDTAS